MKINKLLFLSLLIIPFSTQSQDISSASTIKDFVELPILKWKYKINASIFSSPVVDNNTVYFGGNDSTLYSLDLTTGKENWRFKTGGEIRSTVCIGVNHIILNGGDGILYSLNKSTGKMNWTFIMEGEANYDFADYFQSTPVLKDKIIYFGSGDGNVYAVREDNGTQVWSFHTDNIIHSTPAIFDNKLFIGAFDGNVYALDISNGKQIWKFKTVGHDYFHKGEVQGSPVVFDGLVFIGARDYNVYALDIEEGFCHWNKAFTKGWGMSMNIFDSTLYIGSADERVLISADPNTGSEHWKKNMEFLVFGNMAFSEKQLYVGTTIGKLHAINLKTGEKKWSFSTDSYKEHHLDYFKADDSYRDDIYSIIKSNEEFLEVECKLGGIFTTPSITNDFLIFTSTEGNVYCLKRK